MNLLSACRWRTTGATWARLKSHIDRARQTPEERLQAAVTTVNPVGYADVETLPDYSDKLESLRHMLTQEPSLARGALRRTSMDPAAPGGVGQWSADR